MPVESDTRSARRFVEISRQAEDASGRRIIWGEVMVPAQVSVEPGETYRQSELDKALHFDGMFLTTEAVRDLAYRGIRTPIDTLHNNRKVSADIVESFVARDDQAPWTPGAWVVGVQVLDGARYQMNHEDRDVWEDIERGTLTGFSIDFRLMVEEFSIVVTDDEGENPHPMNVLRGTEPVPLFLSLVPNPAVGRHFQQISRSTVPFQDLPLADTDREWNSAAAVDRVRQWAGGVDDLDFAKYKRAFLWYNAEEPRLLGSYKLPIADVVDGSLRAIPRAIFSAAAALEGARGGVEVDGEASTVRTHVERYYRKMDRQPPWQRSAQGGNDYSCATSGCAIHDENPVYEATMDTETTTNEETPCVDTPELADTERQLGQTLLQALRGLFTAKAEDMPAEEAVEEVAEEAAEEVARALTFAASLERAGANRTVVDGFWSAVGTMNEIIASEEANKQDLIKRAFADFAEWAGSLVDSMEELRSMDVSVEARETVQRGAKQMTRRRLDSFKSGIGMLDEARDALASLLTELSETSTEERSIDAPVRYDAQRDMLCFTAEGGDTEEVTRGDILAAVEALRSVEELKATTDSVTTERDEALAKVDELSQEVALLRSARPPVAALPDSEGDNVATPKTPTERLRGTIFPGLS